ncbi:MAG TPA: lipopolysaccharide heptosyltransferase II [Succinivibrionaceae bacterium]|nr:lipopolysaccharide heptosyltransferase II [Succinivibrionaceae bacterium]
MQRVLIITPSWLGDIIMMQSLLKTIRAKNPSCIIDVYAPSYAMPILHRMDEINGFLINPFAHGQFDLLKRFKEGLRLKQGHYDTCFVLPNSLKSALPAFFAGIPDRRGFKGESRYLLLNHLRTNKQDYPRMVDRYVALAYSQKEVSCSKDLPAFPYPKLKILPPEEKLLQRLRISLDRPLLALGCGANYGPAKLWPVEYFAYVSTWWIEKGGAVLGLGTLKDAPTIEKVRNSIADPAKLAYFYDIAGKTDIEEALDLTGACKAAVCNDSGLMHTAAAAGVAQVDIFGSTSTVYTPPLSEKACCVESDEPCHPCFKRTCRFGTYACLKKITPDLVIRKLEALL